MTPLGSVRRLPNNRFQGVFGGGGPGCTKCFSTELAARSWARAMAIAKRNIGGTRGGKRSLPTTPHGLARLPVGVTYSRGKWFARSPRWFHGGVVQRVFSVSVHGREGALTKALDVAKAWLHP